MLHEPSHRLTPDMPGHAQKEDNKHIENDTNNSYLNWWHTQLVAHNTDHQHDTFHLEPQAHVGDEKGNMHWDPL